MTTFLPWQVLNVDLATALPDLPHDPARGGVQVVFWLGDMPLGESEIPAAGLPLSASRLRELALQTVTSAVGDHLLADGFRAPLPMRAGRHGELGPPPLYEAVSTLERPLSRLAALATAAAGHPTVSGTVSVIVCTRDRPEQLGRCLASLRNSAEPADEVVVVDNAPDSDATRSLVDRFPEVRYVREPRPGLSIARNTGIAHASGDIIAFTDDDVTVHPQWVAQMRAGFDAPQVMALTGLVLAAELDTEAQWIFEKGVGGFAQGFRRLTWDPTYFRRMRRYGTPVWRIGAGANMAFRRELFDRGGGFDERLGAGAAGCSEDSELWYRLLADGWSCRYEPTAVVFHHHRRDFADLESQARQYARGHVAALLVQFEQHRHWGNLYRVFIGLPSFYVKLLVGRALKGSRPKHRMIGSTLAGYVSGIGFYLRNRTPAGPGSDGNRTPLREFLARNPFGHPLTLGFFFREKMRAIHRIAPDEPFRRVLDVGGGQGGLAALLYPRAEITNLDMNAAYGASPTNRHDRVRFVCGDATALPFGDGEFDAVVMFDLLEHVPDDRGAAREALRVLRGGGVLMASSPNENWRFPYYSALKPICPTEEEMFAEWGHVRRGYTLDQLRALMGMPEHRFATFINPVTVIGHDIAFSRLPRFARRAICAALAPVTWLGYALHRPRTTGTETAAAWRKP